MEKRIYSLNLISYLAMELDYLDFELRLEGTKVYAVFPPMSSVGIAINQYRNNYCQVNLHDFLNSYSEIRNRIKELKDGISNGTD